MKTSLQEMSSLHATSITIIPRASPCIPQREVSTIMTHRYLLYCTVFLSTSLSNFSVFAFLSQNVGIGIHPTRRRQHLSVFAEPIPRPGDRTAPQGGDMAYTKFNINSQLNRYTEIRNVGGLDCITDVYARSLLQPNIFWFTGKLARCTGTHCMQMET